MRILISLLVALLPLDTAIGNRLKSKELEQIDELVSQWLLQLAQTQTQSFKTILFNLEAEERVKIENALKRLGSAPKSDNLRAVNISESTSTAPKIQLRMFGNSQ